MPGLTLLLVTHDRYFLDNVCDELDEIERAVPNASGAVTATTWEKKALADAVAEATQQRLQGLMRRELADALHASSAGHQEPEQGGRLP